MEKTMKLFKFPYDHTIVKPTTGATAITFAKAVCKTVDLFGFPALAYEEEYQESEGSEGSSSSEEGKSTASEGREFVPD